MDKCVQVHAYDCRKGELQTCSLEDAGKFRDNEGEQNEKGYSQRDAYHNRILEGGHDIRLDLVFVLDDPGEALEHLRNGPAGLAREQHAAIEGRKRAGMFPEGIIERGPLLYVLAHDGRDFLELDIFGLILQHLEELEHRDARLEQSSELLGKKDQ